MLGTIFDIKRLAVHDGPGIRTTLFLKGCPLKCLWCHNPEGISSAPQLAYYSHKCIHCGRCVSACEYGSHSMADGIHSFDRSLCRNCGSCSAVCLGNALVTYGKTVNPETAAAAVLEDRAFYGKQGGVTVSGGEPLLQYVFVKELFSLLKAQGIGTAVDTCGCVPPEALLEVIPCTDIFLYDIKHIDSEKHRLLTGRGNERILDNLRLLSEKGCRIEIRIPLLPGMNDDVETVCGIGRLLQEIRPEAVRVLPYHSLARSKYAALSMRDTMPKVQQPGPDAVRAAVGILRGMGLPASGADE